MAMAPKQIYMADLIRIFQGPLRINECISKKKICPDKSECVLRSRISGIEKEMISELARLLSKNGRPEKSITYAYMEVPCCFGLVSIIK